MGSGEDGVTIVNATLFEKEFKLLNKINEEQDLLKQIKSRGPAANSDHYWFTEKGVPAFFTNYTLKNIASIENIENGNINYEIFKNLAYGQWKIEEIYDGSAWDFLSKDLLT